MEDETDLRDPDLLEELVSSDGDSEGSESEDSEVEPERTAADHGYNLRPKRMVAGTVAAPERNKKDAIAPGEGVVADHRRVGGRDERISRRSSGVNTESENSGEGWKRATRECAGGPSTGQAIRQGIRWPSGRTTNCLASAAGGRKRLESSATGLRPCMKL